MLRLPSNVNCWLALTIDATLAVRGYVSVAAILDWGFECTSMTAQLTEEINK